MKLKNVKCGVMAFALTASFIVPQTPQQVWAAGSTSTFPLNLFGDDDNSDTGLGSTSPTIPSTGGGGGGKSNSSSASSGGSSSQPRSSTVKATSTTPGKMNAAKVPEAYSCPLFDNRPHAELISAIDSLSKEVKASPECTGSPSAKSLEDNGNAIKESISALQKLMTAQDPSQVNVNSIESTMASALTAVGNLGDIVNNNNFLNSKCGRQTMSTGKVLLALNDVINGLAPYALFAVSMNAALGPALPFVIGGAVATSGISAIAKMIDQNTLDMSNPEHRKAVLQNTCQYTKVAKKVRFMQLAQSGKIEKITQELEKNVDLYNAKFAKPTGELANLLKYKDSSEKYLAAVGNQFVSDKADITTVEEQIQSNNDDLMVCTLANELVNWGADGKTFPSSAIVNLERATVQSDRTTKLQALTLKTLHTNSMKRVAEYAAKSGESESALKACAQTGRSWIQGIRQAVNTTGNVVAKSKSDLEVQLSSNADYRQWKAQYTLIETERTTIKRVEKAMQQLSQDNSIIDRSELAQRMVNLKSGLFGSRSSWGFGKPPVLAWINHTKTMHDQAVSGFIANMKALRAGSYSLTDAGLGKAYIMTPAGGYYTDPKVQVESQKISQNLANFTLDQLPVGSRENEIACQQLESAWLDWSSAIDHIGAIQFFCDMIDPVLDVKMDASVVTSCRGNAQLNGRGYVKSTVDQAKFVLSSKGFQNEANLVSKKLKELQCPMPAVSVMNQ